MFCSKWKNVLLQVGNQRKSNVFLKELLTLRERFGFQNLINMSYKKISSWHNRWPGSKVVSLLNISKRSFFMFRS